METMEMYILHVATLTVYCIDVWLCIHDVLY